MKRLLVTAVVVAALVYLRDPDWVGNLSSGFRSWEVDSSGRTFRWTAGRATFFVRADASFMTIPLRAVFPGRPGATEVRISSDDRWLAAVPLPDPAVWVNTTVPLSGRTSRRYRRIDLRVNRVVPPFMLGVMVGEVETTGGR